MNKEKKVFSSFVYLTFNKIGTERSTNLALLGPTRSPALRPTVFLGISLLFPPNFTWRQSYVEGQNNAGCHNKLVMTDGGVWRRSKTDASQVCG